MMARPRTSADLDDLHRDGSGSALCQEFNCTKVPISPNDIYGVIIYMKSGNRIKSRLVSSLVYMSLGKYESSKVNGVFTLPDVGKQGYFLPLVMSQLHAQGIQGEFVERINEVTAAFSRAFPATLSTEQKIVKVLSNLICKTVVSLVEDSQVHRQQGKTQLSTCEVLAVLELFKLLLWAKDTFNLHDFLTRPVQEFVSSDQAEAREKQRCPDLGEFLVQLATCQAVCWEDTLDVFLVELFKRNQLWCVKNDYKLGLQETSATYRKQKTFCDRTTSHRLVAFMAMFKMHVMPLILEPQEGRFPKNILLRQTADLFTMGSWGDFFRMIGREPMPEDDLDRSLEESRSSAVNSPGYRRDSGKCGWKYVRHVYLLSPSGERYPLPILVDCDVETPSNPTSLEEPMPKVRRSHRNHPHSADGPSTAFDISDASSQ